MPTSRLWHIVAGRCRRHITKFTSTAGQMQRVLVRRRGAHHGEYRRPSDGEWRAAHHRAVSRGLFARFLPYGTGRFLGGASCRLARGHTSFLADPGSGAAVAAQHGLMNRMISRIMSSVAG